MNTKIIFSADDAGIVPQIDNAIADLVNRGILNSAEVLTNYGKEGANSLYNTLQMVEQTKASGNPIELGIHLTITSGKPLTQQDGLLSILDEKGQFVSYRDLGGGATEEAIYNELKAQAQILLDDRELGSKVTHMSNHHDALWFYPQYTRAYVRLANELNLPIRNTKSIPESNSWFYYVFQNLLRKISQADKDRISKAYQLRKNGYFPQEQLTFLSTDYMDNRHYEVNHLWDDFDPRDARIVINRKKRKLKKMIEEAGESRSTTLVEFMFHVRKGKILDYSGTDSLPYYNGVDPRYFDGRTLEYRSLRDNQKVIERFMQKKDCEMALWKEAKEIILKKG